MTNSGEFRPSFGPDLTEVKRSWPSSAKWGRFRSISIDFKFNPNLQIWPGIDQTLESGQFEPLSPSDHCHPRIDQTWPESEHVPDVGRVWPDIGQIGPKLHRSWPKLVRIRPELAMLRPRLATSRPTMVPNSRNCGPNSAKYGHIHVTTQDSTKTTHRERGQYKNNATPIQVQVR